MAAVLRALCPCLSLRVCPRAMGRVLGMAPCTSAVNSYLQFLPAILTFDSCLRFLPQFLPVSQALFLQLVLSRRFARMLLYVSCWVEGAPAPSPCTSAVNSYLQFLPTILTCNSYPQFLPAILTCNFSLFLPRLCVPFVPASPSRRGLLRSKISLQLTTRLLLCKASLLHISTPGNAAEKVYGALAKIS